MSIVSSVDSVRQWKSAYAYFREKKNSIHLYRDTHTHAMDLHRKRRQSVDTILLQFIGDSFLFNVHTIHTICDPIVCTHTLYILRLLLVQGSSSSTTFGSFSCKYTSQLIKKLPSILKYLMSDLPTGHRIHITFTLLPQISAYLLLNLTGKSVETNFTTNHLFRDL